MTIYAHSQTFTSITSAHALAAGLDQLVVVDRRDNVLEVAAPLPYTTGDLLEDATSRWGWPGQKVMEVAQELFEMGWITYPRTDSTRISPEAQAAFRDAVAARYGPAALGSLGESRNISPTVGGSKAETARPGLRGVVEGFRLLFSAQEQKKIGQKAKPPSEKLTVKSLGENPTNLANETVQKAAEDAHEAICPTDASRGSDSLDGSAEQGQLYELIWRRSLASQMKPARYRRITVMLEEAD